MNFFQVRSSQNVYGFLTIVFFVIGISACTASNTRNLVEEQFNLAIEATVDPKITFLTEKERYYLHNQEEAIAYRVINSSTTPIYFRDDRFNIQAYWYDPNRGKWLHLELEREIDPQITVILPGPPKGLSGAAFILPRDIPRTGMIRLVVIGWSNPANPDRSRVAAFKDIEIVP